MNCLHCGDCCRRMSPLDNPLPCRNIIEIDGMTFCRDYENRPKECKNHEFDGRFCPIGISIVKPNTPQDAYNRINHAYGIIKAGMIHIDTWEI